VVVGTDHHVIRLLDVATGRLMYPREDESAGSGIFKGRSTHDGPITQVFGLPVAFIFIIIFSVGNDLGAL
jgi:hypothetical protein